MKIQEISLDELTPYERNPRRNDASVDKVAASIREFGFKVPIVVDKDKVIVAGHTRYKAALQLGLGKVPCIVADDLTDEQIKAFRLADNKVGEGSEWDMGLLDLELLGVGDIDMEQFGFEFAEPEKEAKERPEVEFTEVLGEEHNYIVLYFDNDVDWLQMQSLIDVGEKMNLSTRKDGKIGKNMKRLSVGRVFNGKEVLERLREQFADLH